jgi:hypothetical protein
MTVSSLGLSEFQFITVLATNNLPQVEDEQASERGSRIKAERIRVAPTSPKPLLRIIAAPKRLPLSVKHRIWTLPPPSGIWF